MNERAAKVGVWAYLLFTVASFALALFYLLNGGFRSNVSLVALPVWMGYTAFTTIKSVADLIGAQNRTANFTRMLDRWEDTFGKRSSALVLLAFMTIVTGAIIGVSSLAIGGTSVIIVVGVALETTKAMEAQMMMRHYKGFLD